MCEDSTFHIEGRQGSTPATGAALAGGSCPHTCMFRGAERPRTCECRSPCPSLHLPCPLDCLCPCPHRGLRHSCSPHLRLHPRPLSVHVGTPCTHTPCTVRVHTCTVCTCSIRAIHAMCPGTCKCRTLGAASVPVFG